MAGALAQLAAACRDCGRRGALPACHSLASWYVVQALGWHVGGGGRIVCWQTHHLGRVERDHALCGKRGIDSDLHCRALMGADPHMPGRSFSTHMPVIIMWSLWYLAIDRCDRTSTQNRPAIAPFGPGVPCFGRPSIKTIIRCIHRLLH